jgi:preprotein translocase subunit SecA
MRYVEKQIVLQVLDHLWREHIVVLDHLRQVIGWRGVAQRDPLNEYKSEAFELFNGLIARLRETATAQAMRVEVAYEPPTQQLPPMFASHADPLTGDDDAAVAEAGLRLGGGNPFAPVPGFEGGVAVAQRPEALARDPDDPATWGRVGRNELCPCGTGKKYKHCHGAIA